MLDRYDAHDDRDDGGSWDRNFGSRGVSADLTAADHLSRFLRPLMNNERLN